MKYFILFAALVAVCIAVPVELPEARAEILAAKNDNDGVNGYDFNFETSNGISRKENGVLRTAGDVDVIVVDGVASWTSPEGVPISLHYNADENGYHPIL